MVTFIPFSAKNWTFTTLERFHPIGKGVWLHKKQMTHTWRAKISLYEAITNCTETSVVSNYPTKYEVIISDSSDGKSMKLKSSKNLYLPSR